MLNFKTKCKTGYISTSLASWGSSWVSKEAKFIKKFDFLGFSRCFSVRIEQTLKNHLKRINVSNTATCPLCGYGDETVEHHLFDCVALKELRKRFLPPNANIHRCLYDTSEQMRKTCSYFRIASGQRAKAQVPLVH